MFDTWDILLALSGWGAWVSKEIISKLMVRGLARSGRLGLIEGQSKIVCDTDSKDGRVVAVDYFPEMMKHSQYADCRRFRVKFECQFFNDTDTQVVYKKPDLEFWGVEGQRLILFQPRMLLFVQASEMWQEASTIAVPAHSVIPVLFEQLIGSTFESAEEAVNEFYGESVVLLKTQTIGGKPISFRLCTRSFAGKHYVTWTPDRKYPIFGLYSLNENGRRSGRRPQERQPKVAQRHEIGETAS